MIKRLKTNTLVVWVMILTFVVTFGILSLQRHAALGTNGMDLGNVNQTLWNTAHGRFLAFTNMAPIHSRLALHVEPILLLFVPLYWLGLGGPRLLLIVQALVVGLGTLPLYWLARDAFSDVIPANERGNLFSGGLYSLLPLVFPLVYLLLPALEGAVMYDFHAVTMASTFLLFAFYFLKQKRTWSFVAFALLTMACKEDMGLTVAMLGLYAILAGRQWRLGGVTFVVGVVWFLAALFVIQPQFSPMGVNVQADRYSWLGKTPMEVTYSLFRRPEVIYEHLRWLSQPHQYLLGLLIPTAFLAIFSPLTWLPALPSLAVNLFSSNPFTWRLEDFHYAAPIAPFVLISALYGCRFLYVQINRVSNRIGRWVLPVLCGSLLLASLVYHWGRGYSPLASSYKPWQVTSHEQRAGIVFGYVPDEAAVFVQSNLNPHLSSRRYLYQGANLLTQLEPNAWETATGGQPFPDYLLFDVSSLVNQDGFQSIVLAGLLESGFTQPSVANDGFLLLDLVKPGVSPGQGEGTPVRDLLPEAFFDFARAESSEIQYPLVADFGDALRLHGLRLQFNRAEEVQPTLYFEALRPLEEDYFIALYLLDEWGTQLGATGEDQPALVWYPTHSWRPGELVKVRFNTLPWFTRDVPVYRLAVGVMHGRDVWQPGARLLPSTPPTKDKTDSTLAASTTGALTVQDGLISSAIRLPGDGTLLELARFQKRFGFPYGAPAQRQYRVPATITSVDSVFGGQVRLVGYDHFRVVCNTTLEPDQGSGCWLGVVLYWQSIQPVNTDYKVFAHVVGSQSESDSTPTGPVQIWGQRDAAPDNGAYPFSRWATGEVVADPVRIDLPSGMPSGTYDLIVGLYEPETGIRLPIVDGEGHPVDDKMVIGGAITVP